MAPLSPCRLTLVCVAAWSLSAQTSPSIPPARGRVAAVIAVGRYRYPETWHPLGSAEASAREFGRVLTQHFGFRVAEGAPSSESATAARIDTYLGNVLRQVGANDDLVVYFAGHGVSLPTGEENESAGYLAPYDAPQQPVPSGLIEIHGLLKRLAAARSERILVVLDACESGVALPRFGSDSGSSEFSRGSRVLITSADARQTAIADGGSHGATLFTGILLDLMETGECDISGEGFCTAIELGLLARRRLAAQKALQTPVFGSFGGDESADFRLERLGLETQKWLEVKKCDGAAQECLSTSQIEAFLTRFPSTVYAAAARKEIRDRSERAFRAGQTVTASNLRLVAGTGAKSTIVYGEEGAPADDRPQFKWVPDDQAPFWMERFEVSVSQYRRFLRGAPMPRAPAFNRGWNEAPDQPMVNVSWAQAQQYCASLGGVLPSQEQWLHAARYGQNPQFPERFPWNNEESRERANLAGARDDKHLYAAPVQAFPGEENQLQLRNLIGNVSEWTSTPSKSDSGKAVVVGGSFADTWKTAGFQWHDDVELSGSNTVGFRCIVIPQTRQ